MIVIGLTGSIAMGKSEAAKHFQALGVPVFDSDAEVHGLYAKSGAAVFAIDQLAPAAVVDGAVDRRKLAELVKADPQLLKRIEQVVHPLVRQAQDRFLATCSDREELLAVLDIPLLFETGRDASVDVIVVVSAPAELQRHRALARPGMTAEKLDMILARQLPDAEKRARAHFVVDTSGTLDDGRRQVAAIVEQLKQRTQS